MEKNENILEAKKMANKPSILNKIKHKANILFKIFPFVSNRPFILPYLIERDSSLNYALKNSLNNMKSKNFSSELIDKIHEFMVYKLMQALSKDSFAKYIINNLLNFNQLYYHRDYQSFSFLENYNNKYIIECIENEPIPFNMNIDLKIIKKHSPSGLILNSFIEDFFYDEIVLFYTPLKKELSSSCNKDIIFLNNLNSNNNYLKIINLICIIPVNFSYFYQYMIKTNYKYIKKLYFIYYDDNFNKIFNKIEIYLNLIEHKENIKSIYFHNTFSKAREKEIIYFKVNIIYQKIGLEYLVDNYFEKLRNNDKINTKFNSLENIEFDDEDLINNIQVFKLRYNLNEIFDPNKFKNKLIMITPEDYNNIVNLKKKEEDNLNKKLDKFWIENTKYKILFLNMKNNSPYNKNFIYFCEKFLYYNKNINIIIIDNLGDVNKDNEVYNFTKSIKKLRFPNLKCIIFEDEITLNNKGKIQKEENNEIGQMLYNFNYDIDYNEKEINFDPFGVKSFINKFFDISNFNIYEGYNDKNHLIYLNISKNITVDELYRIFYIDNKVSFLKLINENIEIKFNKDKKQLTVINRNNKEEKQLNTYKINTYHEFFYKLNKNMDLHFDNGKILSIKSKYSSENEEDEEKKDVEEEEEGEEKEKEEEIDKISNEDDLNEIGNFLNSEILTEEKEFSLLSEGILEIENISKIKNLKFNLIYRAKSDKNKIEAIIDKIGKNKYMLILIKTNKGNIFGAYAYFYDYDYYNKGEDKNLGVVFNFKKEKLFYDIEGLIWKNNQGIEIKNYFYITKPSFSLKNKIINNLMEIGETNFTCRKMEVYDVIN